ncbi:MAG TPA: tRNA-dependent cyclodipeptide synthase [Rhizomicrobium sp.]|jgi:tRNA-dependent cyclodipeptide synthase|nr:tRNA-dependent cyclodipeptide synthase [Rhizomicrobium sp.]
MTNDFGYSVRVKNGSGWRRFDRVRLMISVGQPYHEGEKLRAVVDWINRNPSIREVQVSVNDLLQRHNHIAAGIDPQRANAVSSLEGTAWIERNEATLSELRVPHSFTRWDEWLDRPEFDPAREAIIRLSETDAGFAAALDTDAHALAERKRNRGEALNDYNRHVSHSRDYVIEELAVFALQAQSKPAAEVYPGSNLASAQYLVGKKLPEPLAPLSERYFTRIDFARISLQPSCTPQYAHPGLK